MRELNKAQFKPAFQEALSGEFEPLSDAKNRVHTLTRLAFSTYVKGKETLSPRPGYILSTRYRPSWSPQVDVHTDWHICGAHYFAGLNLSDPYGHELHIGPDEGNENLVLSGFETLTHPLVEMKDIADCRELVSNVARNFFDESARTMALYVSRVMPQE